jgi:hypothetical protein
MFFPKVLVLLALSAAIASAGTIVTLDTSPLDPSRTWYLDFQLADGDSVANNTVSLSLISFGGGSGNFLDTTLSDAAFFEQAVFDFTPGTEIRFNLSYTTNFAGGSQDTFTWAVLDDTYASIVDNGLLASLVILLDGSAPQTFAATVDYRFIRPALLSDAAVPEPGTVLLAAFGLAALALTRRGSTRARRRAPRP